MPTSYKGNIPIWLRKPYLFKWIPNVGLSRQGELIVPPELQGPEGPQGPQGPEGPQGEPGSFPSGVIVMWSGLIENIPSGWVLCDGNNGTPNLTDRFILGTKDDIGDIGGSDSITLNTEQLPSHFHSETTNVAGNHSHSGTTDTLGNHSHTGTTNTTGDHTHDYNYEYRNISPPIWDFGFLDVAGTGLELVDSTTKTSGDHSHTVSTNTPGDHSHTVSTDITGNHTHNFTTGDTGSGHSIEITPPYYKLAFIMKL